ncbi:MAG TPA: histidine phosphatase family protein, partial [Parafilimonas sp.]
MLQSSTLRKLSFFVTALLFINGFLSAQKVITVAGNSNGNGPGYSTKFYRTHECYGVATDKHGNVFQKIKFEIMKVKSLLLVRHAKSSWEDIAQKDFDRPLNQRGKKDAPAMAKRIRKEKKLQLDAIISSPAKRALSTAKFFADEFDIKKKHIIEKPELYEAAIENFYN